MARMTPARSDEQLDALPSKAEVSLFRALRDKAPDSYHVYHSVGWVLRKQEAGAFDGEADFLIAHRDAGLITVEVKGGGIGYDAGSGAWYSTDRHGVKHSIKDPVAQARQAKFSVLAKIKEHPHWSRLGKPRLEKGHAVFFPDISNVGPFKRADLPAQLLGGRRDLDQIEEWLARVFEYWRGSEPKAVPLGTAGIGLLDEVFASSFEARPLLADALADEEETRVKLTSEQTRILDVLQMRRRVAVSGGAGTGKTVLAVEKARRLAEEGFNTLLICYNRPLADHLKTVCRGVERLTVLGFHELCRTWVEFARQETGRDVLEEAKMSYPGENDWHVQYPNALAYATEVIPYRYEAIVCDEGQDFGEDYWLPVELLLVDGEESPLYIFYDDNQNIYKRRRTFPVSDMPFTLTVNCRNTDRIHEAAYRFYRGNRVDPPGIEGVKIETITADGVRSEVSELGKRVRKLIHSEGIPAQDIAVLVLDAYRKHMYYEEFNDARTEKGIGWAIESTPDSRHVLVDTVNRFKGLEASVIYLIGLEGVSEKESLEKLYVGMSRAKSLLGLVGQEDVCAKLLGRGVE